LAVREFPALGFDPAPGDAAALSSAAGDEDVVLDVMDFLAGWSGPHTTID
jgi:hypothetical protein